MSSLEEQFLGETHGIQSNGTAVCGGTPLYNISIVASPKSPPRFGMLDWGMGMRLPYHHIHHTHIHYTCSYLIPSLWAWPGNETVTSYLPHKYYACGYTLTLDGGVGESLRVCGTIHVTIPTVACCSADGTCATPSIGIIIPTTAGEAVRVWFTYLRAILICGG